MAAALAPALAAESKATIRTESTAESEASQRIDRYKILQKLGEGGCGVVYLAEQTEPVRRMVALKVIKLGMDTKQVIARFEAERQALALMDHPNIAKVLDAGTTEKGRPYFVMELVKGIRITDYCDQHLLPTAERLGLFTQVCQAIQHAHQKGIIHRDIKPSNILVTLHDGVPVPKVIDFGIAKATEQPLTTKTVFTAVGQFMGTPAYMSPEQAELSGLDIDTRSDIYALGVLLYELLTGKTPFDARELLQAGLDEMRRRIREDEPMRPSTRLSTMVAADLTEIAHQRQSEPAKLTRFIRGDLDWIVMKCLEKDRNRRYETANGLAMDLRRHLSNEPVVACPPSAAYRFQKMVRRNKLAFVAATAVAAALLLGLSLSTWLWLAERKAHDQAMKAEQEGQEKLREAYLSQARANRWSGRPGRRFDSLDAVRKAAKIRPGLDLRNEAIAALALMDLQPARTWESKNTVQIFDSRYEQYVLAPPTGAISVRRVRDDVEIAILQDLGLPAFEMMFSPDGRMFGVHYRRNKDFAFKVYDLENSNKVRLDVPNRWVRTFRFSPDGRRLVLAWTTWKEDKGTSNLTYYDLEEGGERNSIPLATLPYGLTFNSDGSRIAISSADSDRVQILSVPDGKELQTLVHPTGVHGLAWASNDRFLAAAGLDGHIHLWDLYSNPATVTLLPQEATVVSCWFNSGGEYLMSFGWNHLAKIWNVRTGKEVLRLPADLIGNFSPDDRWVGGSHEPGTVTVSRFAAGNECRTFFANKATYGLAFSPDGRWLASGHSDGMRLWDLATGFECHDGSMGPPGKLQFSPDGQTLVTCLPDKVLRWPIRITNQSRITQIEVGPPTPLNAERTEMINNTNRMLAAAKGIGYLFDATSGRIERQLTCPESVFSGAVSPDGRHCATWGRNAASVLVWDAATGRELASLALPHSPCVAFSPDGRWLITGSGNEYVFWERGSWSRRRTIPRGMTGAAHGKVAFTRDGATVALAMGRGDIGLFDTTTFEPLATLESPEGYAVSGLDFSADGSRLAVGTTGQAIHVWDLNLIRQQLAELNLDMARAAVTPRTQSAEPIEITLLGSPNRRTGVRATKLGFVPRDPRCTPNQLDLTRCYNSTLTNSWFNPEWEQNDLSQLPQGFQILDGVQFDIRGVVQLSCSNPGLAVPYPKEVGNIPMHQTCRVLHFLHGCGWATNPGADIGEYVIHYADGAERSVPLTYQENIWRWWDLPAQTATMKPGTTLAWRGRNPLSDRASIDLLLFHFRWENPRPNAPISTITFRSRMTPAAPFLLAITAE